MAAPSSDDTGSSGTSPDNDESGRDVPGGLSQTGPFPSSLYGVRTFGAAGDGQALDTEAIQRAVDRVSGDGGGTLYFPPGDYLSGTVRLRDNVTLFLENGSTIWGSTNMADYNPDHKHLLYAANAKNITLTGAAPSTETVRAFGTMDDSNAG